MLAQSFGLSTDGVRVSLVTFGERGTLRVKFDEFSKTEDFSAAVAGLALEGGNKVRIDRGLEVARDSMFLNRNGARRDIPKVLVVLTDGSQTDAIGIRSVQRPEMVTIVS